MRKTWKLISIIISLVIGMLGIVHGQPVSAANTDDEIVYLNSAGRITVLDPIQQGESPAVEWTSPTAGWVRIALGDVNGDNDQEIIAIGTRDGASYLAVFDPVAARNASNEEQLVNGIPWELLFETGLDGAPRLVAVGEFNLIRPGPEIIYSYELPPEQRTVADDYYRFVVLYGQGDGREWIEQTTFDTGNEWTWIATGDIDNAGIDEVALADSVNGTLAAFRVVDGFERIFRSSSNERPWYGVAIGAYDLQIPNELIAVREADYPLATAWAFRYSQPEWVDVYAEVFVPSPRYLFLADITGNGDDEIAMLRRVPQELGNRPRFFIRDNGNDTFELREATLDADNGYRSGTGADTNGDGRDEIVLARDDRIRIYTDPVDSTAAQDYPLSLNSDQLWSGNLDSNGLRNAPRLVVQPSQITANLTVGETGDPILVTLQNAGSAEEIAFSVDTANAPAWIEVDGVRNSTPSSFVVRLRASGLPPGTYEHILSIRPVKEGVQQDVDGLRVSLVVDSGVAVLPAEMSATLYPCDDAHEPFSRPLAIEGTRGITFTVSIDGTPQWLTVTPVSGTIPAILTATFSPNQRDSSVQSANVRVTAVNATLSDQQAILPVLLLCAAHRLNLPLVLR